MVMSWRYRLLATTPFAGIPPSSSPFVVVGVPLDATGTYKPGTRFAPSQIRAAAANIEFYSLGAGLILEDVSLNDIGDITLPPGDVEGSLRVIEEVVRGIRDEMRGSIPIFLGGEHLITYPVVRALREELDYLVVFDAHLDVRNEYYGSKFNHATFLRRLVEEGVKVVHLGSRAYSGDELEYVKRNDIEILNALNAVEGSLRGRRLGRVYVSIDMDVVDPAYAPGVGNPEPFGLAPTTLLRLLKELIEASDSVVGFDIVEVNPLMDVNDVTSVLAAKLVFELIGLIKRKTLSAKGSSLYGLH